MENTCIYSKIQIQTTKILSLLQYGSQKGDLAILIDGAIWTLEDGKIPMNVYIHVLFKDTIFIFTFDNHLMAIWTMEYHRRIWNLMQAALSGVNLT